MKGHDDDEGSKSSFRRSRMFSKFFLCLGASIFTCFLRCNFRCRFRGSMVFGHFQDMPGRFNSAAKEFLFIDRKFLAENQL